jgi:TolB-like protein
VTAEGFLEALGSVLSSGIRIAEGTRRSRARIAVALVAVAISVAVGPVLVLRSRAPKAVHPRTAIAVLPFENLSPETAHAYFAGGLHDELLTHLQKVGSLTVISRTSVRRYTDTQLPVSEIADQLGVGSIVEGSVQVVGERLRVIVQLIDTSSDAHLWGETYDRALDDAFAIQSDIAARIVTAVGVTLAASEREVLRSAPTASQEAYQLYLQAREYQRRPEAGREEMSSAEQLYDQAIRLDPNFALAHAALSELYGEMFWLKVDPLPARMDAQQREAETALRIDPDLPEAHLAMGFWHYVRLDWPRALEEYETAARGMPNDAHLVERIGYVHRRLGNWDQVESAFERAILLDPRDAELFYDLGGLTFHLIRRYEDAIRAYDRALTLAPDFHHAALMRAWAFADLTGQRDTIAAVLERIPEASIWWYRGTINRLLRDRKADSLILVVRMAHRGTLGQDDVFAPSSLTTARAHLLLGDTAAARLALDSALVVLDSAMLELGDDWRVHSSRGRALAGLGRRTEALEEARWLLESPVYTNDALRGPDLAIDRAIILAETGEHEMALDEIERQLAGPGWLSAEDLGSPTWDPLRGDPRFEALTKRTQPLQ